MTKKQQKAENAKRRNLWTVSPVTRVIPDKRKSAIDKACKKACRDF